MRDPDLVTRAQRAAVALERAWERWRAMHGLSAEPMPPVSSYVGYSIEEPWGRPRVVFGVDAREAELLAALLDHHECVGPFYQADPSDAALRPGSVSNGGSPLDQARPRIPAQAPATEARPQRWSRDAEPGPADGGPADDGRDDQDGYPGHQSGEEPYQENGAVGPARPDETRGGNGRATDQRRGRRAELSRPSRRERRSASRQRSAASREPMAESSRADTAEQAEDDRQDEGAWPPEMPAPSWADPEIAPADSGVPGGPVSAPPVDITTVDSIPVQGAAAGRPAAGDDLAGPGEGAPRGKSLYDVTKASRERARKAGRDRGAGRTADRRGTASDLGRPRVADAGRGARPTAEPISSNGASGDGRADAGLRLAAPDPAGLEPAAPMLAGLDPAGDQPQHGLAGDAAQDLGYPAQADPDLADGGSEARWAEDTDPGLDYSGDQGLDYADDPDVGYLPDADRDYPGDESWDDLARPDEPWSNGFAGAAGSAAAHDADHGRSDAAGLDQLWDIGRGPAGHGHDQAPSADARQPDADLHDAAGPDLPGSPGPAGAADSGAVGAWRGGAGAAGARFESGLGPARDAGSMPDGGPAPDTRPARDAGPSGDSGSAWDAYRAREAGPRGDGGSAWDARPAREPGSADDPRTEPRDAHAARPGDYGPDPLGAPGGRQTADFLAAPPPSSTILTTAPRQNPRTARPSVADPGTETIAAELAGWAAGELPGQASARLAAWAAIGGVPAPGYRSPEGSGLGSPGVATERVR